MEVRLLEPMLLERPPGCEGIPLGVRVIPGMSDPMSSVAQSAFRNEAEALREEIGLMFLDGRFGKLVDNWFVFSNIEAHSMVAVQQERERNKYVLVALTAMTVLIIGLSIAIGTARRAKRAAEHASRAKSTFLANVSHEIRTPMNGVLGMCELLSSTALTPQQKEYAETIGESARRQLQILNELLDSAKIEAGRLALEAIPFCPADLLKDIERAFRGDVVKKGLAFQIELVNAPAAVSGDPLRVHQIVSNLVGNAVKFTQKGGIHIKLEGAAGLLGNGLTITVSDTGVGISLESQARLFHKFVQGDESTTRRFGGTGLGLSICRDLAELMGGSIGVQSTEGQGTTFRVSLPLPVAQPRHHAKRGSFQQVQLHSALPILVVEDNLVNQKVAGGMLRSFGLTFQIANSGLEGVALCASKSFAMVLMDCQMPGMDGFEATRQIRAKGLRIPIVAVTASAGDTERRAAFQAGMNDFLPKPISREDLLATLRRWLPPVEASQNADIASNPAVPTAS